MVKEASGLLNLVREDVNSALERLVTDLDLEIQPQVCYALTSGGKRVRPIITILSARCVGCRQDIMPLALAFELVHTATLVHDDIIDKDEMRRQKPALHVAWSVNDGILTGDVLIALSIRLASSFGEKVMVRMAKAAMELCDGEHADALDQEGISENEYLRIARRKSASLFGAAAECGAIAGGASSAESGAISRFGENFGIAYQMRDDLEDMDNGKILPSFVRTQLDLHCDLARDSLSGLGDTPEKRCLMRMAESLRDGG